MTALIAPARLASLAKLSLQERNFYYLGIAIALFDPDREKFTAGCLNNLLEVPYRAPVVLREHWDDMVANPDVAEVIDQIDWYEFYGNPVASLQYFLGYYHARKALGR